jgi:hypothetical protein
MNDVQVVLYSFPFLSVPAVTLLPVKTTATSTGEAGRKIVDPCIRE